MALYAVGDIQGCYTSLRQLLDKAGFDPKYDTLWCVGDMVNRGPDSLKTLRFLKKLGDACVCILGNHDLHLLELAAGAGSYKRDTLRQVMDAPDAHELIEWLRFRPLFHRHEKKDWCMVHAGLHPHWTLGETAKRAAKVEKILRGRTWKDFCMQLHYARFPTQTPRFSQKSSLFFTTAVLTRSRYCTQKGTFNWSVRAGESGKKNEKPWFKHEKLAWKGESRVVYGHWAAMGLVTNQKRVLGLDSGCVWGGGLTLAKLGEKSEIYSVPSAEKRSLEID